MEMEARSLHKGPMCSNMRLAKLVFLGSLVLVTLFLFSSHMLITEPRKVRWITSSDFANLFMPQSDAKVLQSTRLRDAKEESNMADVLYKKVRVLCWIMTSPKNMKIKARAVYETWARRCNVFLFMSSAPNHTIPNVVALNVSEGRGHLTMKTMKGFQYAWNHYKDQVDWFMKADDDTYVIVENLRYLLAHHDPNSPVYFGHQFKVIVKQGYMSGGAGYVMSKEAVRRVVEDGIPKKWCKSDHGAEDVNMGDCLQKLGVKTGLSIDTFKRESFHPFNPGSHVAGSYPDWYFQYTKYGKGKGRDCCSDYTVTFHYIDPNLMYTLDFLIYRLKTFGVNEKFNTSLIKSVFQHSNKKPFMQTIAALPTSKPNNPSKSTVISDQARMEKVKKFLEDRNIKVIQDKTSKPAPKPGNKVKGKG